MVVFLFNPWFSLYLKGSTFPFLFCDRGGGLFLNFFYSPSAGDNPWPPKAILKKGLCIFLGYFWWFSKFFFFYHPIWLWVVRRGCRDFKILIPCKLLVFNQWEARIIIRKYFLHNTKLTKTILHSFYYCRAGLCWYLIDVWVVWVDIHYDKVILVIMQA